MTDSEVRSARLTLGMTQRELGKWLGVTGNYIWMVEAGRKSLSPVRADLLDRMLDGYIPPWVED